MKKQSVSISSNASALCPGRAGDAVSAAETELTHRQSGGTKKTGNVQQRNESCVCSSTHPRRLSDEYCADSPQRCRGAPSEVSRAEEICVLFTVADSQDSSEFRSSRELDHSNRVPPSRLFLYRVLPLSPRRAAAPAHSFYHPLLCNPDSSHPRPKPPRKRRKRTERRYRRRRVSAGSPAARNRRPDDIAIPPVLRRALRVDGCTAERIDAWRAGRSLEEGRRGGRLWVSHMGLPYRCERVGGEAEIRVRVQMR